jgi:hypothetical protein
MCFAPAFLCDPDDCTGIFKSQPRGTTGSSVSVHPSYTSPHDSSLKDKRTFVGCTLGVAESVRRAVVGEVSALVEESAVVQPPSETVCSTGLPTRIVRRPRLPVGQRWSSSSGDPKRQLEAPPDSGPDTGVAPSASASGYTCTCPPPHGSGFGTPRRSILLQLLALLLVGSGTGTAAAQSLQLTGAVRTLAGEPGVSGRADGFGTNAKFSGPVGIALNTDGTHAIVVRWGAMVWTKRQSGVRSFVSSFLGRVIPFVDIFTFSGRRFV